MATRNPVDVNSTGRRPPSTRTKGTFFCPECSHRSRFDGDWTIVETGRAIRYLCPACEAEVTTRRTSFPDDVDSEPEHANTD